MRARIGLGLGASLLAFSAHSYAADTAAYAPHPQAACFDRLFHAAPPADFRPTGLGRADYLKLIADNVAFFRKCQRQDGAIIDPVTHEEKQYSTPAFAVAAGLLVRENAAPGSGGDLLEPAQRALSCSLTALLAKKAANAHSDFYIPLIMHAYRELHDRVPADVSAQWREQLRAIDPVALYRQDLREMNWNLVSFSGEALRRHDDLVDSQRRQAQADYLEESITRHLKHFTPLGMYEDPGAPLAYDAFSRLWLEDAMADSAYDGPQAAKLRDLLRQGALSSLLLLSPTGEWASGGRSAFHQWNEAELAAICEIEAVHWKNAGGIAEAGAFKRAAHLALASMRRWQRPSGELNIVKNLSEPQERWGYEGYSFHTQYNLLPMAMLAIAYERADESIAERATPAEVGGYVFDLRDRFHKIAAAAGGYYVLVDTGGDPHYNATGLQRVMRAGVPFSPLSDSTAPDRAYGPPKPLKLALAPGLTWLEGRQSLAECQRPEEKKGPRVLETRLEVLQADPSKGSFRLSYTLEGAQQRQVLENYTLSPDGVEMATALPGYTGDLRARIPALVSDGAHPTELKTRPGGAAITWRGCTLTWDLLPPNERQTPTLADPTTVSHNGEVRPLQVPVQPAADGLVHWRFTLRAR